MPQAEDSPPPPRAFLAPAAMANNEIVKPTIVAFEAFGISFDAETEAADGGCWSIIWLSIAV